MLLLWVLPRFLQHCMLRQVEDIRVKKLIETNATAGDPRDSLGGKVQGGFLVLGLVSEAVLPGEAQHVLDRIVDAQSAGVVERRAALVIFAA